MIILRSSNSFKWTALLLNCIILSNLFGQIVCPKLLEKCRTLSSKIKDKIGGGSTSSDVEDLVEYDVAVTDPTEKHEIGLKAVYEKCTTYGKSWNFFGTTPDGQCDPYSKRFWFPFNYMHIKPRQENEDTNMVYFEVVKETGFPVGRYIASFKSEAIANEFQKSILQGTAPKQI